MAAAIGLLSRGQHGDREATTILGMGLDTTAARQLAQVCHPFGQQHKQNGKEAV
jgi:hypothetical protein